MHLPFSSEQFFDAFGAYNSAVWPMQWVALAAASRSSMGAMRMT
jgi:hypothetical protein